jgi:hypothetical protein
MLDLVEAEHKTELQYAFAQEYLMFQSKTECKLHKFICIKSADVMNYDLGN